MNRVGRSLERPAVDAESPDVLADLGVDGRHHGRRQYEGQGRRHDDVDDGRAAGARRERFAEAAAAVVAAAARSVEVERRRREQGGRRPDAEDEALPANNRSRQPRMSPHDAGALLYQLQQPTFHV